MSEKQRIVKHPELPMKQHGTAVRIRQPSMPTEWRSGTRTPEPPPQHDDTQNACRKEGRSDDASSTHWQMKGSKPSRTPECKPEASKVPIRKESARNRAVHYDSEELSRKHRSSRAESEVRHENARTFEFTAELEERETRLLGRRIAALSEIPIGISMPEGKDYRQNTGEFGKYAAASRLSTGSPLRETSVGAGKIEDQPHRHFSIQEHNIRPMVSDKSLLQEPIVCRISFKTQQQCPPIQCNAAMSHAHRNSPSSHARIVDKEEDRRLRKEDKYRAWPEGESFLHPVEEPQSFGAKTRVNRKGASTSSRTRNRDYAMESQSRKNRAGDCVGRHRVNQANSIGFAKTSIAIEHSIRNVQPTEDGVERFQMRTQQDDDILRASPKVVRRSVRAGPRTEYIRVEHEWHCRNLDLTKEIKGLDEMSLGPGVWGRWKEHEAPAGREMREDTLMSSESSLATSRLPEDIERAEDNEKHVPQNMQEDRNDSHAAHAHPSLNEHKVSIALGARAVKNVPDTNALPTQIKEGNPDIIALAIRPEYRALNKRLARLYPTPLEVVEGDGLLPLDGSSNHSADCANKSVSRKMPTRAMDEHEEHQVGKVTEMSPKLRCRWASEDSEYQRRSGVEAGHRARSQLHEHETQVAREMPEDSVQSTGLNIAARCAQNEHDPLTECRRFKAGLVVRDTELGVSMTENILYASSIHIPLEHSDIHFAIEHEYRTLSECWNRLDQATLELERGEEELQLARLELNTDSSETEPRNRWRQQLVGVMANILRAQESLEDRIPNVRLAVELQSRADSSESAKLAINAMCSGNRRHVRAAANGWVYRTALSHGFPENSTASGVSRLHLNSREVYKNIHRETVNLTEGGTDTHVLAVCSSSKLRATAEYWEYPARSRQCEKVLPGSWQVSRSEDAVSDTGHDPPYVYENIQSDHHHREAGIALEVRTQSRNGRQLCAFPKMNRDKVASRDQYGRNTRCSMVRYCPVESGAAHELRGSAWSEDGCLRDRKVRKIAAQPGRSEIPWHGTYRAHPKLPTEHEDRKSGRLLPKRRGNTTPQCAKDTLNYLRHRRYSVGDVGINHAAEIGEPEGSRSILVAIAHENGGIPWRFILTEKRLERGQCNRADSIGSARIDIGSGVCKFGEHEILVELRPIQAVVRQRTKQAWNISRNCGPDALSKTHNFAQLDADNAASAPEKPEWVEISAHIALISKTQRTKNLVGLSFTFKTGRLYSPCNQVEMHGMGAEFNAVVEVKRECRVLNRTRSQLGVPVGGVGSRAEIHRHLVRVEFAVTWSRNQEVHPFQRMRLKTRNTERQTNDSGIQSSNESSMVRSQQRRTTEGSKDRVWLQKCSVINCQSNNSESNESSSFEMIICIAQADANSKFKDNPKGS
ncbi:hypothetical protein K438DRAFT_1754089 [Mycena galopus ATCC 62051]|nr:hypothetical protein K438DRAFT_1754089 [Mycena galopus ATCC 62051]